MPIAVPKTTESTAGEKTSHPLTVVHIITRLIRAGADENTVLTCVKQADEGHRVVLIHGKEHDPAYYKELAGKVELICADKLVRQVDPVKDFAAFMQLNKMLQALRPVIVHTHTSKAGILGRLAAKKANVPAIVHGVHIVPFVNVSLANRLIYLTLERLVAPLTDAFIDVSSGMRDICIEAGVGRSRDHFVVHSGFDVGRFSEAEWPEDWRTLLDVPEGAEKPPVLLMLAALTARKRHVRFLEQFPRIVAAVPDVRLLICGEGEERDALLRKVSELGLEANVKLVGFRKDPERLIALSDLCTLASEREGLPRVVMQYLAGGRPCALSALPGIEEVARHGKNAVVAPSERLDLLADNIIELLQNPARLAELQLGAEHTSLESWDADKMWPRMKVPYRQALSKSSISPKIRRSFEQPIEASL